MGKIKRIVGRVVLAGGVLVFFGSLYSAYTYHRRGEESIAAMLARTKKFQPAVLADMKLLNEQPPFAAWTRERNAEPFLTRHISWASSTIPALKTPDHEKLLKIKDKYRPLTEPHNLKAFVADPVVQSIDVAWMEQLPEYDHWNLTTAETLRPHMEEISSKGSIERIGILASLPLPDYMELRGFALVYLAQKIRQGRPLEGFKIYRKVAELSHTSSTLIGNMVAVAMLNTEREVASQVKAAGWTPVSKEVTAAYKRASWGMIGLAQLPWYEEVAPEVAAAFNPRLGACASVSELSTIGFLNMADFFEPRVLFESDYSANYARVREFASKMNESCGLKTYDVLLSRSPAGANPLLVPSSQSVFRMASENAPQVAGSELNPVRIPYVRRVMGMVIVGIATPSWFGQYEKM
jgi:hypothetical protein